MVYVLSPPPSGENPEYARKKAARKAKRKAKSALMIDGAGAGYSLSDDVDLRLLVVVVRSGC